jgi:phosphoglycerate dehydrogenase-like enzyme
MDSHIEILITLPFPEELVNLVSAVSPRLRVTALKAEKADDIPAETWQKVEVLYTATVLPDPDQAPRLRWIQFHWAGIDSLIDHPILRKPDLVATSLSGAAVTQMAEYILMMLLALGHRLPALIENQRAARWPKDRWKLFSPRELRGSTVGIVGYGSIGREVARLLNAFGTTVLATKRDVMHPQDEDYVPAGQGDPAGDFVRRLYPPQALRSMIKECDFIVVTVPLTKGTHGLIGEEELKAMRPTAFLVDVSRGGVLDHSALITALREGKIAGAALDVFEEEPLPAESPLWKLPNVFVTPHIAGVTPEYDARAVELFAENLKHYLEGKPVFNQIDLSRGY